MDLARMQPNVYFDDYDVICLGSPIVAGYPLKIVSKLFSLGAHTGLEEQTAAAVEGGAKEFTMPPAPGGGASAGGESPGVERIAMAPLRQPRPLSRCNLSPPI